MDLLSFSDMNLYIFPQLKILGIYVHSEAIFQIIYPIIFLIHLVLFSDFVRTYTEK
jgi:hypothetical protein